MGFIHAPPRGQDLSVLRKYHLKLPEDEQEIESKYCDTDCLFFCMCDTCTHVCRGQQPVQLQDQMGFVYERFLSWLCSSELVEQLTSNPKVVSH